MPFCTKQTHIFLHWGKQQQHNLSLIIFLSVSYLIFVCKLFSAGQLQWLLPPMEGSKLQHPTKSSLWRCHQRELVSSGQLQWLLPSMEVSKFQHPTKSSTWCSDDGLILQKRKAEVYLGSMESKHTTRFTRKKRAKK
jgi:hypothetical protein